jgi:hypothetical protein
MALVGQPKLRSFAGVVTIETILMPNGKPVKSVLEICPII